MTDPLTDWLLDVGVEAQKKGIHVATWCDGVLVLVHPKHKQEKTGDLGLSAGAAARPSKRKPPPSETSGGD